MTAATTPATDPNSGPDQIPRWLLLNIVSTRHYMLDGCPDLQDATTSRRMVIRPRLVSLNLIPGTTRVYLVTIKGRQVCRDGELAGAKMILVGISARDLHLATPPAWLMALISDEGLELVDYDTATDTT